MTRSSRTAGGSSRAHAPVAGRPEATAAERNALETPTGQDMQPQSPPVDLQRLKDEQKDVRETTDELAGDLFKSGTISRKAHWWRPAWWREPRSRLVAAGITLVVAFAIALAYHNLVVPQTPSNVPGAGQVAAVLVAAAAGVFTYQQWADSRREESLDRFYQRLGQVNARYAQWEGARALVPSFWQFAEDDGKHPAYEKQLYVYLELDNLEYMLVRYELGFVSKELLMRALRTFASRMVHKGFRDLAGDLVNGAGYSQLTGAVVNAICKKLNTMAKRGVMLS